MSGDNTLLNKGGVQSLLAEVGRRCAARGINAEMFRVGGGAMASAYSRDRVTRDLDAIFEPQTLVYAEARGMAEDMDLPPDWLNDGVKGLMPDRADGAPRVVYASDGLTVFVASPEYMSAMKAASARQEVDTEDMLTLATLLGITRSAQGMSVLERYYSPRRFTPKMMFFVEASLAADMELTGADGLSEARITGADTAVPQRKPLRGGKGSNQYQRKPRR